MTEESIIPPMTNIMGKNWIQPELSEILISSESQEVVMPQSAFIMLRNYSSSYPSGVYEGKMWKRLEAGEWYLCWYGKEMQDSSCDLHFRPIIISDWKALVGI